MCGGAGDPGLGGIRVRVRVRVRLRLRVRIMGSWPRWDRLGEAKCRELVGRSLYVWFLVGGC